MKTIEIVQTFKHGGQTFYQGERRVVSEGDAGYFCGLAWAKDLAGETPTGEPDLSPKKLIVQNGRHKA
jgi:hypothetical protein